MPIPHSHTVEAFELWAKQIASDTGFVLGEKMYQGTYYTAEYIRDVIYAGTWEGMPAVLKLYNDPRLSDEPLSLESFHQNNQSDLLLAPKLYRFHKDTPKRGWLIMEKLPQDGSFFRSPLSQSEKIAFMDLYMEYRQYFPKLPTRPLTLAEKLPSVEYHRTRIAQWFCLANEKEEERRGKQQDVLLLEEEFLPRYLQIMDRISKEFVDRKMIWCHGHFKPQELYRTNVGTVYLTDFAHTKMYPEGYELAFIVWADRLMAADWCASYDEWKAGIDEWTEIFRAHQRLLGFEAFDRLWRASLLERSIGTVLADITASDKPREEQEGRIAHLYRLIDDLLNE